MFEYKLKFSCVVALHCHSADGEDGQDHG
jgi:hypothetical protein